MQRSDDTSIQKSTVNDPFMPGFASQAPLMKETEKSPMNTHSDMFRPAPSASRKPLFSSGGFSSSAQEKKPSLFSKAPVTNEKTVPVWGAHSLESGATPVAKTAKKHCSVCRKSVGVMGFTCKCGHVYCTHHRQPESHQCTHDWLAEGQARIAKANPVIAKPQITAKW